jgi:hypothetical protein
MGQAKAIVEGASRSLNDLGVIGDLAKIVDRIDRAIELKQDDLGNEPSNVAENHHKLGLLKASNDLIRRAKAMLEDYGKDIEEDTDPIYDEEEEDRDEDEEDED